MGKKALKLAWHSLALVGIVSLCLYVWEWVEPRLAILCEEQVQAVADPGDGTVKATAYVRECGAGAATRAVVTLSHPSVNGVTHGQPVLILLGEGGIELTWDGPRHLIVSYPGNYPIEFAIIKVRGISIEHNPMASIRKDMG